MDSDKTNSGVRPCGQIGEGEDDQMSLMDVVNEHARLQADADAVLGGSDEYNCTYPQDYLKRQALYACATCTPEGNAGICLACSYACHEGHDIYELYTKRCFKCDCGNDKFKGNKCQIYKEKKHLNARNHYNQNFRGLYCICSRPYPDEEDSVEDEMIQCIVCEDWYHGRHLKAEVPDNSDYHEMICSGCMCKYSFLWAYHVQCSLTPVAHSESADGEEKIKVDVLPSEPSSVEVNGSAEKNTEVVASIHANGSNHEHKSSSCTTSSSCSKNGVASTSSSPKTLKIEKRKADSSDSEGNQEGHAAKKIKIEDDHQLPKSEKSTVDDKENGETETNEHPCLLKSLQQREVDQPDKSTFWSEGWRSKLCRCSECMEMYKDRNIEFLIDDSDTMQAYEAKGCEAQKDQAAQEEADAEAFASMNRVQQIEVVRGFVDLKSELNEFLQGFAREGKVVKESDIREFFQRMEERRRERVQLPQHNCR